MIEFKKELNDIRLSLEKEINKINNGDINKIKNFENNNIVFENVDLDKLKELNKKINKGDIYL